MIEIQLKPEVEAQHMVEAQARGLALDLYVENIASARPIDLVAQRTVGEAIDRIRQLRKGNRQCGSEVKDLIHEGHQY